jgi:hypothetical protein
MTERWTDELLDQFAASVEAFAKATETNILGLQRSVEESRQAQRGMFRAMDALAVSQVQILQRIDNTLQRIDEVQSEVRGLQTENRRILDHLFGLGGES